MTTHEEGTPREELTVRLPFGPRSARTARQLVKDLLAQSAPPDQLVEDALLVVHELVLNGVTHGRPDQHQQIEVFCALSESELFISVLDQGTGGTIAVRPPSPSETSGRGLAIVAALSRSWSVDRTQGTRVSARLAI